ncbi:anti-sigma factor domain-containing protein [Micromonospora sp. AMSO31t]|uniref:anti-sigma factor n=1 Tax=Micromonospora sp. AMSO31t TaxID=2650566 RepID=UPI00124BB2E3|nr:anti-sigma factor [Micromonospora sp. AMSO31t]KAB1911354.1 anti-sigma factor [Micromonospora sp. AMSO31t]
MTDIHALAGAYVLDAVDDVERAAFVRHLDGCETCALEVAELREAAARLADPTWSVPPPALRDAVLAEIRRTPQERPGRAGRDGSVATRRWRRRWAAAAAAVALAGGAGAATWTVQEQRVRDARSETDAARHEAARIRAVLAAPDAVVRTGAAPAGGRVTVVASASRDEGVAVLDGLAPPAAGRAYQLWLIGGRTSTSAGVLPAGRGGATMLLDGVRGKGFFGVTEEPAGGSVAPSTAPLVTVALS